ncbi:hypothetical protein Hanom_Chr01g00022911 [Helianthus anomalus]
MKWLPGMLWLWSVEQLVDEGKNTPVPLHPVFEPGLLRKTALIPDPDDVTLLPL